MKSQPLIFPVWLRLLLSYFFVGILPLSLLASLYLTSFESALRETMLKNIDAIADKKADQIDAYLMERMDDARLLGQRSSIKAGSILLGERYQQDGLHAASYQLAAKELRDTVKARLQLDQYYDMLLIDVNGNIIFSLLQEAELGSNLDAGPYRDTPLAEGYRLALLSREVHLSHFASYAPSGGRQAAFVVSPILNEGVVLGAVALQLDLTALQEVVSDPTGLGISGETILARKQGDEALFISPLKKITATPFQFTLPFNKASVGIQQALVGNYGRGIMRDYSETEVIAAWRYLPALNWAMVTKIETAEAFAPIMAMRQITYLVLILFLVISIFVAYFLSKAITVPVHKISKVANDIAKGNINQRVKIEKNDEIGRLGFTFNHMADALQEAQKDLEKKVEERTREIKAFSVLQSAFLENAGAMVVVLDREGRIRRFNAAAEALSGYTFEEIEGKIFSDVLLPEEEANKIRIEAFESLFSPGKNKSGHYKNHWLSKSGQLYLTEWNNSVLLDDAGKLEFVVAVGIDITDRQRSQDELLQSTQRLNEAQRIAKVGSWELNLVNNQLVWSDEIYRLFEIDQQKFGASYEAFLQAIHPDDRDRVNKAYNDSVQSHSSYEIIHRLLMVDGRIKWVQERGETFYNENGQPMVSKGTVQDITAQKMLDDELVRQKENLEKMVRERTEALEAAKEARAELAITIARLKEAQRVARVGSWEYNVEKDHLYWSEEMYRLHGLDPLQGPPDQDTNMRLYNTESAEKFCAAMEKVLTEGAGFAMELCMSPLNETPPIWVYSICNAVLNDQGNLSALSGTVQDITAQKMLDEELNQHRNYLEKLVHDRTVALEQAKEQAENANQSKSQFLSNMSHELRTPMNAILGFTQLLDLSERLDNEQQDYVQEILKGGYHLLDLINDVLDLAKIESGKLNLQIEPVNINDLVSECFSLMQPLAAKKSIEMNYEELGDIAIQADHIRLRQVLLNILGNAIKYNSEHGKVLLTLQQVDETLIRICVSDTGWGIAAENLDHIFEPFYRINAEHAEIEGTGIGLSITKNLVELMGGKISVESHLGMGSCFSVELPMAAVNVGHKIVTAIEQNQQENVKTVIRQKVLYIEDNPANLKLVGHIMAGQPHIELIAAHEALLGLELAISHEPVLILLDINMPHMDGYKVLGILQQDERLKNIPVIAITANAMAADIERGKSAGFSEYLTKPLNIKRFLEVVNFYLSRA